MADRMKGGVTLKLSDGRTLTLEYDFDGLIALEEAAGMRMPEVYAELQRLEKTKGSPSLRLSRAIIFGGLQQHHPEMTLKEAGDLILKEAGAIDTAMKAMAGAHGPADGEGPPADGDQGPTRSSGAGTGETS